MGRKLHFQSEECRSVLQRACGPEFAFAEHVTMFGVKGRLKQYKTGLDMQKNRECDLRKWLSIVEGQRFREEICWKTRIQMEYNGTCDRQKLSQ